MNVYLDFAAILPMMIVMVCCYVFTRRYSIDELVRGLFGEWVRDKARNDLVVAVGRSKDIEDALRLRLIVNPESITTEFRDDLSEIYGHENYLCEFERDRQLWLGLKWASPGIDALLRDIKLAKSGKVDFRCYDYGFEIGEQPTASTVIRYRRRVETLMNNAGKPIRMHMMPRFCFRGFDDPTFLPEGTLILEHQLIRIVGAETFSKIEHRSRPW